MASAISARTRSGSGATIPGADLVSWYFLRVSGLLLIVLAFGHVFVTHYLSVPADTTFDFVSKRWANPLWRTFDWLLLLMALWHGLMGLRTVIYDYIRSSGWRVACHSIVWVLALVFTGLGSVIIFTFDAQASLNNTGPLAGQTWIADVIGIFLYVIAVAVYVGAIAIVVWVARNIQMGRRPIYAGDTGQYAGILHRAAGLGILFFLLIHIIDIMLIGLGRDVYDKSVNFYSHAFLVPMEIALVGAVLYHGLNGLRVIAIDFSSFGIRKERRLFWIALVAAILITVPSAVLIIMKEVF